MNASGRAMLGGCRSPPTGGGEPT